MKRTVKFTGLFLILTLLIGTTAFASETVGSSAASEQTTYTLEEMLQYALEDERIAQAEYEAIMESFDVTRPFSNIAEAEKQHEAEIIALYEARGMEVSDFDASEYVVLPDTLAEIYEVGIQAEINNIAMYDLFLAQDLDADVRLVFEEIKNGSESHLAAFERSGDRLNERTVRQSESLFDSVLGFFGGRTEDNRRGGRR